MRQFRVGRVADIPVRMDASVVVVSVAITAMVAVLASDWAQILNLSAEVNLDSERLGTGMVPWLLGIVTAVLLLASVLGHELGHCLVARRCGLPVESITFWLFGGAARIQTAPATWRHEAAISLAGPAASLLSGLAATVAFLALAPGGTALVDSVLFVLGYLIVMNSGLAVVNMLPVVPMDGGQTVRAVLARSRPYAEATKLTAVISVGVASALALVGVALSLYVLVGFALLMCLTALVESR
jgi:Zn-dependent protease